MMPTTMLSLRRPCLSTWLWYHVLRCPRCPCFLACDCTVLRGDERDGWDGCYVWCG